MRRRAAPPAIEEFSMIECQRQLFDLPEEIAYLNCSAYSPLMHSVAEAGRRGIETKVRPWRIASDTIFDEVEEARELFGRLIGAAADDVALVPAASYGLATAAANLRAERGQRLIVLEDQFPSNVQPWWQLAERSGAELVTIPRPTSGGWTEPLLQTIDAATAVVALPNCHWCDGTLVDLVAVGRRCRQMGAALALDLTQSIGAMPFDVAEVQPDFLVSAGYKWLMAPYSLGFMYVAPKRRGGVALEYNRIARSMDPAFNRLSSYALPFPLAARQYDVGEVTNFILVPMAAAAMRQLLDWGTAEIQVSLRAYTDRIAERAEEMGLIVPPREARCGHFLGIRFPGGPPKDFVGRLAAEGVYVSQRADAMRLSPHLYNDEADLDRLFAAVKTLL
jgi:selenocysteine lyase/cysteine desulfurase